MRSVLFGLAALLLTTTATLATVRSPELNSGGGDAASLSCRSAPARDPFTLYGEQMSFEIRRDGKPVGSHQVSFARDGRDVIATSRFELAVRVLGITAYRYQYVSRDVWRDGCLIALNAEIDDNGTATTVVARAENGTLRIEGPKGVDSAPAGIFPTNHWHSGVLDDDVVLNTLTGRVNRVAIVDRGPAMITINGRLQPARHYAYTGDLGTEVWYDGEGRWVGLRFPGTDSSTIELVCRDCAAERSARQ